MIRPGDLDWSAIALAGDVGATAERPAVAPSVTRRPRRLTIALLIGWLLWEGAGLVRALTIGPPILKAIWESRR